MPYTAPVRSEALFRPAAAGEFFAGFGDLDRVELIDLYCSELARLAYAPFAVIDATLRRQKWHHIAPLENVERSRTGLADSVGFVATSPALQTKFLVFRGTEAGSFEDTLTDLWTLPVEWNEMAIHGGFARCYSEHRERVIERAGEKRGRMVITGHSLGGALAHLAATDFQDAELVTFGSPRVGDQRLANLLSNRLCRRYVNCCDIVTRVPPPDFDEQNIARVFDDLFSIDEAEFSLIDRGLIKAARAGGRLATTALAKMFPRSPDGTGFVHVNPPTYIDSQGTIHTSIDEEFIAEDQRAARGIYRSLVHEAMPALDFGSMFHQLGTATRSTVQRDGALARTTLKAIVHNLLKSATMANVVVRDFADHAPSTYTQALQAAALT